MAQSRAYKRFEFLATATIQSDDNQHIQLSALVDNISQNGISLHTYDPIEIGTNVRIQIVFTTQSAAKARASLKGKVVRLYRKNESYFLGITFEREIKRKNHPILFRYFSKGPVKFVLKG